MGFNYGLERKKFEAEWARLKKEYEEAGMSAEAIQEMYDYDLNVFNRKRADAKHEQPLTGKMCNPAEENDESLSSLLDKFENSLSMNDTYSILPNEFRWIDEIQNENIYQLILGLPLRDKEFLTYLVEGYSREEIAKIRGVKIQSINKKISKFKKLFAQADSKLAD